MSKLCPLCNTEVKVGIRSITLDCGHLVHSRCLDQDDPQYEACKVGCKGPRAAAALVEEEIGYQNRDYIETPVTQSLWESMRNAFRSSPLLSLLQQGPSKMPVESLIRDHNYGLHRMLHDGVHIEDFLTNGYTWSDLKKFRECKNRLPKTLWALGCTAEHLRDYKHALPVQEMGLTPQNIVEYLGLVFQDEEDQPYVVDGKNDRTWTAEHLADLGMDFQSLVNANMKFFEQYESLLSTDADDARLGVTAELLHELPNRPQPKTTHAKPEPTYTAVQQPEPTFEANERPRRTLQNCNIFAQQAQKTAQYVKPRKTTHRLK